MACVYKQRQCYWISYYVGGTQVQKSLRTSNERVAVAKKRRIEYELSLGDLHAASELHVPEVLDPELTGGEQVVLIPIVLKGSRLADELINHVPIVDGVTVFPSQSGQHLDPPLGVPDLDTLSMDASLHVFPGQSVFFSTRIVLKAPT